jgi:hypothetical protein
MGAVMRVESAEIVSSREVLISGLDNKELSPMTYRTILVELQRDGLMEGRLRTAKTLGQRFEAVVIGLHVMPTPVVPASFGEAAFVPGP